MVEFLSAAWIARLDAAARAADDLVVEPPFTVATVVRDAHGERGYQVRFGTDGASVTASGHEGDVDGEVALITDPATAWALHEGSLRAQDAFARGLLKVRGRPELLAAHGDVLAALERALAPVRADTTPPEWVRADR
jgi:hypothetical protein